MSETRLCECGHSDPHDEDGRCTWEHVEIGSRSVYVCQCAAYRPASRGRGSRDRERIRHAWGQLEQVFIDGGTSKEWVVCAVELWKQIDAALLRPSPPEGPQE